MLLSYITVQVSTHSHASQLIHEKMHPLKLATNTEAIFYGDSQFQNLYKISSAMRCLNQAYSKFWWSS